MTNEHLLVAASMETLQHPISLFSLPLTQQLLFHSCLIHTLCPIKSHQFPINVYLPATSASLDLFTSCLCYMEGVHRLSVLKEKLGNSETLNRSKNKGWEPSFGFSAKWLSMLWWTLNGWCTLSVLRRSSIISLKLNLLYFFKIKQHALKINTK